MKRLGSASAAAIFAFALSACSNNYTRHMSETYKDAKIDGKSFAILPIMDITYTPPSSCFGNGGGTGAKYEQPWLSTVEKDLKAKFSKQKFHTYSPEELQELKIDAPLLYSQAADEIAAMGVTLMESGPEGAPKLAYETARSGGKVAQFLRPLHDSAKVDYVIILVQPKMTGETQTNFNAQGGMTQVTKYTSDIQFGIWSTETGELAYSSGAISTSSGFCFFLSPQQGSINGTSNDISLQLKVLIARLLEEQAARPDRLGWSGVGSK